MSSRSKIPVGGIVLLVSIVAVFGVFASTAGGQFGAPAPASAAQETATPTPTATATPTSAPKEVDVVIEHWENKVGIAINGGEDAVAITDIRVEGATMTSAMDMSAEYPKAVGTVEAPTTVRVIATFDDGTTQVIAEQKIS